MSTPRSNARLPLAALWLCALAACSSPQPPTPGQGAAPAAHSSPVALEGAALVARGGELVSLGGCGDCHTPMKFEPSLGMPVPDLTRAFSGHPQGGPEPAAQPGQGDQAVIGATFTSFRLPFGVVYARNLTPHPRTGLGEWTPEQFVATMRSGHRRGDGRVLLPPMPWQNLAHQSESDLRAMFAYLQSLPAIDNEVPEPSVPNAVLSQLDQMAAQVAAAPRPGGSANHTAL